jgi:hypothetical protein
MMPLAVAYLGLPHPHPDRGEAQQSLDLGRRHTIAAMLEVALTQPSIAHLFVHAGLPGGTPRIGLISGSEQHGCQAVPLCHHQRWAP